MSKFASAQPVGNSNHVIKSTEDTFNHEGIQAFSRTAKSDLFLLGVTNFVSENTFYESGEDRDSRFARLIHIVTKEDAEWVANFAAYLRGEGNMRSASVVVAAEYIRAGGTNGASVVDSVCQRPDEPAEVLAYWINTHGKPIPSAVKRGVAKAAKRLYNEGSFIKYNSSNKPFQFADVINLTHVKPKDELQSALFKLALDSRYNSDAEVPKSLNKITKYRDYMKGDKDAARTELLNDPSSLTASGMTWESLSSFGPMDSNAWQAIIPNMGYMALLRNLRNFDETGVPDSVANKIIARLIDPVQVARSRQLPYRFYAAYKNAPSLRWAHALETALDLSLKNLPVLGGRSLVLVDTSGSMRGMGYSDRSTMYAIDSAALFGAALAKSGQDVDLKIFATEVADHNFRKGGSTLGTMSKIIESVGKVGHGTNIAKALAEYDGHDRIILLTDMQTTNYIDSSKSSVPLYCFNLAGYGPTNIDSTKNQYEFGGITDSTFSMIKTIEASRSSAWPWLKKN